MAKCQSTSYLHNLLVDQEFGRFSIRKSLLVSGIQIQNAAHLGAEHLTLCTFCRRLALSSYNCLLSSSLVHPEHAKFFIQTEMKTHFLSQTRVLLLQTHRLFNWVVILKLREQIQIGSTYMHV